MTEGTFRIFCLSLVKNEADIIEHCLQEASKWADRIFVLDNGSTDGTWEKVQAVASDRIVPWKTDARPFSEGLRADIFNAFRSEANDGDWWCRLDADEFYSDDPRTFLSRVPKHEHVVWGIAVEYYLTLEDLSSINFTLPIAARLKSLTNYAIANSEPRFFRHRRRLLWPPSAAWPRHMGPVHSERIFYRHYKYRSPQQVQLRLDTRNEAIHRGFVGWWQSLPTSWEAVVTSRENLSRDTRDRSYEYDPEKLPRHTERWWHRVAKLVLHGAKLWP